MPFSYEIVFNKILILKNVITKWLSSFSRCKLKAEDGYVGTKRFTELK